MSGFKKPAGFFGRLLARGMAWGHRDFYINTAKVLDLKNDDNYLEIGFGSGLFIKKYAHHVEKIAGIDYSEDMVNLANNINKDLVRSGKAELKKGDATSLPWENNEFSAVAGIETFYFLPEPKASLKEIYRVLAPGGRLVIEMAYNKDDGLDHTKDIKKMNLSLYSSDEVSNMLKETGFTDITVYYFKVFRVPVKGYLVPKGMVVKGMKKLA
jgi:ubiquinone/menaquinone biosynthesis C-methylase UbiE